MGGGVAVLPLLVVPVMVLVRAPPGELWVLALQGVVGDALVDGGVLRWGRDLATPGGSSHGRCWPLC